MVKKVRANNNNITLVFTLAVGLSLQFIVFNVNQQNTWM